MFSGTYNEILSQVLEIKEAIRGNTAAVNALSAIIQQLSRSEGNHANSPRVTPKIPDGMTLPLQNLQQVQRLEKRLNESSVDMKNLVCYYFSNFLLSFWYAKP